jgi:catabolite regulation protein CreA
MYYRVTEQKTPSGNTVGFNILGGFDPKLVYATAAYRESATCYVTTGEVDAVVAKMALHANAADTCNLTSPAMLKKIAKNDEQLAYAFG